MTTIYVPRDSSAISLGANAVARAIAAESVRRGSEVRLVRNGSRGLFWLEPLVEVDTPEGRIAYGPMTPSHVPDLLDGKLQRLCLGPTEEIPYL